MEHVIADAMWCFQIGIAYWIAFGPHGPRAQAPKGEGMRIFFKVAQLSIASVAVFAIIHYFARPAPRTMSKEWQEASNEYARVCLDFDYMRVFCGQLNCLTDADMSFSFNITGPEHQPSAWTQQGELRGQGFRAEPAG